jgi:hypothetical protein
MALFHREDHKRKELGLAIAMAAHFERNVPELFKKATTDRLEDAADELLGDGDLSFETVTVVRRINQSLNARNPQRPWSNALMEALEAIDEED